jgi:DNA helicase HerA-like ATPase
MAATFSDVIAKLSGVNLFKREKTNRELKTGLFVGRPFYLDYDRAFILVADAWKQKAKGIPQGSFLLAYYENEATVEEALLLRVLGPTKLPTDGDVIASMVEYYKDNLKTTGSQTQLDTFTRYEFSFSGLECRVLGSFYLDEKQRTSFGADVENFYSSHNYSIIKPDPGVLELIVNFREGDTTTGTPRDIRIGCVRYSSTLRFQTESDRVPVYVRPSDFLGKRTALFGMTRTGKSNTVKKIIQATVLMSSKAPNKPSGKLVGAESDPFTIEGFPKFPVGQIIFDVNGEYANPNLQDEGTAIYELYKDRTTRYSVIDKPGFKVMRVNFYQDIESGFGLIQSSLQEREGDYVASFVAVDMDRPVDYNTDRSAATRYDRKLAAYLCCVYKAGFKPPKNFLVKFPGSKEVNALVKSDGSIDPKKGISLDEACAYWEAVWAQYNQAECFADYRAKNGREWADEDLKAILVFLTRKKTPGGSTNVSGYLKLRDLVQLHTDTVDSPFEQEIVDSLRNGRIVIVDLSEGDPTIQLLYSERICRKIFTSAMRRFIANEPNNFVQFYFEEAHNLFPKKEDKDLAQIYNRLAKEGAKLNLGLAYATQEVSSISGNILKNTQNWFIAHLNNDDEIRELKKYYDFGDFTNSLLRFSAGLDRGYVRMKTYSNPFVVPVQIDRFTTKGA